MKKINSLYKGKTPTEVAAPRLQLRAGHVHFRGYTFSLSQSWKRKRREFGLYCPPFVIVYLLMLT